MARQSGGGVEAEVAVPSYSAMSLGNKKRPSGSGRLAKTATRGRLTTNHEEMKWLGGHPGRKQSRRIRSVGHAPKLFHYIPRTGMPELRSVLLRRLHEFVVHHGQTWSSIVLNPTVPSLSRRRPRPITSTKKSFRLPESHGCSEGQKPPH